MAGLRYVSDRGPGFRRRRAGRGFTYLDVGGAPIRERRVLRRIKALVIPPAWSDVWICPLPNGHIQASARDAKGRKQYRYHARWREIRDESKFDRMAAFGEALTALRSRVDQDLAQTGLPRNKLLATVVRLLELTLIRVGNEEYVRANESYGLTTMREKHVKVSGSTLRFRFRGKSGKLHEVEVSDRRLAAIVKRCQAIRVTSLPIHRRRRAAAVDRLIGSQRVPARMHGPGLHRQGLRTWGHAAGGAGAAIVGTRGQRARGEAMRRGRDQDGREASGKHSGHLPQALRAPRCDRSVHERAARKSRGVVRRICVGRNGAADAASAGGGVRPHGGVPTRRVAFPSRM